MTISVEPIAELGVVPVRVVDRVREVGLVELAVGNWCVEPAVVGLTSKTEYPTRHHDGDPVDGELGHGRVHQLFGSDA